MIWILISLLLIVLGVVLITIGTKIDSGALPGFGMLICVVGVLILVIVMIVLPIIYFETVGDLAEADALRIAIEESGLNFRDYSGTLSLEDGKISAEIDAPKFAIKLLTEAIAYNQMLAGKQALNRTWMMDWFYPDTIEGYIPIPIR